MKWYRLAADQGDADAQANLGTMYQDGLGVPQNNVTAYMWSDLASAGGDQEAGKHREGLANKMSAAEIAEAQHLAREWKPGKKRIVAAREQDSSMPN